MIMNPFQIGPCTLPEALEVFSALQHSLRNGRIDSHDVFTVVDSLRDFVKTLGDSRNDGPDWIGAFGGISGRFEAEAPESLELPYRTRGELDAGNLEAIALYLPKVYYGERYGIYFHARRLLELADIIDRAPADSLTSLVTAVGVHELFHAFIETVMAPAEYVAHRCPSQGYCLWEEAAANRAGADWAHSVGADTPVFMEHVFCEARSGGLPGYGDWREVTSDILGTQTLGPSADYATLLPCILEKNACQERITRPDWVLSLYMETLNTPSRWPVAAASLAQWSSLYTKFLSDFSLTSESMPVIPIYVDLVPWGMP